jgi:uncharacterized protein
VALRYGPLIYNVEQADQSNIEQRIGNAPLVTAWRGDLLGGVLVIKSQWADGSPLLAIPNYARNNRTETARVNEAERGNAAIDYSGGATTGTSGAGVAATNPPALSEAAPRRNRGARAGNSLVWIKDEQRRGDSRRSSGQVIIGQSSASANAASARSWRPRGQPVAMASTSVPAWQIAV